MVNFIKKYYGIVILLLGLFIYFGNDYLKDAKLQDYYSNPEVQDLYIFQFDSIYAPYLLEEIKNDSFYFFVHSFNFKKNIPDCKQVLKDSFRTEMYYIYSKVELDKMMRETKISKIYRLCQ
ncbi:hypothetical protein DNU06_16580 [Putridiphycobacter roseus]|uniref:Uncharacterized protein n=1 Tax=Putridiphycobacter roseus TaxID=2219161 RepID=A0A2W1NJB4_9FLAO|nr:hypothetical protein [Putridiphycobacter roseus]PZE15712.1 hypothetical protein DNU06_16580 [Putridiphycobacter roseus]